MGLSACHAAILAAFIVFVMALSGSCARSNAELDESSQLVLPAPGSALLPEKGKDEAVETHIRVKRKKGSGGGGRGGGSSGSSRNSGGDSSDAGKDKSASEKDSSSGGGGWFKVKIGKVSYNNGRGRSRSRSHDHDRDSDEDKGDRPMTLHDDSNSGSNDESANGNDSPSGIKGFFAGIGKWVAEWGIWDDYPDVRKHMQREPIPIGILFFSMGLSALLLTIRLILSCLNCLLQCSQGQGKKRSDRVDTKGRSGECYEMATITGRHGP